MRECPYAHGLTVLVSHRNTQLHDWGLSRTVWHHQALSKGYAEASRYTAPTTVKLPSLSNGQARAPTHRNKTCPITPTSAPRFQSRDGRRSRGRFLPTRFRQSIVHSTVTARLPTLDILTVLTRCLKLVTLTCDGNSAFDSAPEGWPPSLGHRSSQSPN
jgi:hypothetical protein